MGPSDLEYVGLRLVRRFLFRPGLLRLFEPFLPYYRVSVNEDTPDSIVERYARHCRTRGIDLAGRTVLEIGVGATNGTGYELAARGVKSWCGFEPHAAYQRKLDQAILEKAQHRLLSETWRAAVRRVAALSEVPDAIKSEAKTIGELVSACDCQNTKPVCVCEKKQKSRLKFGPACDKKHHTQMCLSLEKFARPP